MSPHCAATIIFTSFQTFVGSLNSNSSSSLSSSSSGSGTLPSACSSSNYKSINDASRHVFAPGMALSCDNTQSFTNQTSAVWVRFEGTGGTMLPLTTPGMNVCGTEGTGWYDGAMPTTSGSIVNGTACFTWYNSVCRFSVSIMRCSLWLLLHISSSTGTGMHVTLLHDLNR